MMSDMRIVELASSSKKRKMQEKITSVQKHASHLCIISGRGAPSPSYWMSDEDAAKRWKQSK